MALSLLMVACGSAGVSDTGTGRASIGGAANTTDPVGSTDVVTSLAAMEKGDLMALDLSSGAVTLDFAQGTSGAAYVLMIQSVRNDGGSASATVADFVSPFGGAAKDLGLNDAVDLQERFEAMLRGAEEDLTDEPIDAGAAVKSVSKAVRVGASQSFRVLSSLYSTSAYRTVTATARCVTNHVAVFLDDAVPNSLSTAQLNGLCSTYDAALSHEFAILGDPPDLNGDGVITVLLTKAVNQLGASGGGIVTGFFFAGDLLTNSSSNPASNEQEIVFALVPDETGEYGTPIPTEFALSNLLTAVVPHEVQHLLSYYQHVLEQGGSSEATWLNEAMSHLIEDVVGYGQENPSRMELTLASTREAALIPSGSPDLAERGAGYLFLRYLYEQASDGNGFLRSLVQTNRSGTTNILTAYNSSISNFDEWEEFLFRWGVALAVTNAGVTTDSRFTYETRSFNTTTGHYQGVCLVCDPEDGRGTQLVGVNLLNVSSAGSATIAASAGAFYDLSSPPAALTIQTTDENDLQAVLIRTE